MRFQELPVINLDGLRSALTEYEFSLVSGIVSTRGESKGRLRASRPNLRESVVVDSNGVRRKRPDRDAGLTAYIWRHVAFAVSPISEHQCMPVMDMCYLPGAYASQEYKEAEALCTRLVDIVVKSVPVSEWAGVRRWSGLLR